MKRYAIHRLGTYGGSEFSSIEYAREQLKVEKAEDLATCKARHDGQGKVRILGQDNYAIMLGDNIWSQACIVKA